jgi:hypothetical protein
MTEINFTNEPKYSEHKVDEAFNERRKILVPQIKELISTHPLFLNKKVDVTFMHNGVSSLVCRLDTHEDKKILKIPLSILNPRLEGKFLKAWADAGVKTPYIFEEGSIGKHSYIIMENIEAKTLRETYDSKELIEKNIYKNLGETLRKMHKPRTIGYSDASNIKSEPVYNNISDWLENDSRNVEKFKYVSDHKLLDPEKSGSLEQAIKILKLKIGDNNETTYCHDDFGVGNIFATDPITVFDPHACFNHPYMDLARSIILSGAESVEKQYTEGYFKNEKYDRKLLQAFLILSTALKLPYVHKKNDFERVKRMQEYLEKTKKYLD